MRRSVFYCEPNAVEAGSTALIKLIYISSVALDKGTKLLFDLNSPGREIDWCHPTLVKPGQLALMMQYGGPSVIFPKQVPHPTYPTNNYEFTLPESVAAGQPLTLVLGHPDRPVRAQIFTQRRRSFTLAVAQGKKGYGEPETASIDVKGAPIATVRVLVPSFVTKNRRFDVTIRFEDKFGNLTSQTDTKTLIELTHENLRENLNWKLFIPETGFVTLPNIYFNETGVFHIHLKNHSDGTCYKSAPIKCFAEETPQLFWGVLHGESERLDSVSDIEACLRHFRDDLAYSFYGTSSFEQGDETGVEEWRTIAQNVADFNEEDRFVSFLGYQYCGEHTKEGMRHILYAKDNRPLLRQSDPKTSQLKKLYKQFSAKEAIAIPTFTAGKGVNFNFKEYDPAIERLAEIYNAWGCSECSQELGNPFPIKGDKKGFSHIESGTLRNALNLNRRFGFVAGGLDDRGPYSKLYHSKQVQYPPGMTAILAANHARDSFFEALWNRRCYATTGVPILLDYSVAHLKMGQEVLLKEKPGLAYNRHIAGFVAGVAPLDRIEIIRNGSVLTTLRPEKSDAVDFTFTYDDMTPLEGDWLLGQKNSQFVYYYIRAFQADGHMAWASPIWLDL